MSAQFENTRELMLIDFQRCGTRFRGKTLLKTALQFDACFCGTPADRAGDKCSSDVEYASSNLGVRIGVFCGTCCIRRNTDRRRRPKFRRKFPDTHIQRVRQS